MVFSRGSGGHVALYCSEDDDYYHIIGGNQGDKVSIIRHSKANFLGARWPVEFTNLRVPGRVFNSKFSSD